ncbi:G8 domain-containing protein [Haloferax namakaokahaiae]|uniref:G8 domain-containing protein n=1 Tax=Haloferax namakaokahaiae TaxID=1748331 RepID=A0ABD5ZJ55_9EURY
MSDDPPSSNSTDRALLSTRRAFLAGLGVGAAGTAGALSGVPDIPMLADDSGHSDAHHVRELVADSKVTHRATGGPWRDPASWDDEVPGDDARVQIPADVTVTLDNEAAARLRTVRVDGTLRADPTAATQLLLDTLVVTETGTLEVGTPESPIQKDAGARLTFLDGGPIDESADPERIGRGLVTLRGATVRMVGQAVTSWLRFGQSPRAGDRVLSLAKEPHGWSAGDTLVVAGMHPDRDEDEVVSVADVDGSRVTLDSPLEFDHVPPRESLSGVVAHLDRAVTLESESTRTERRGHVMFMSDDVHVGHVAFSSLGRTDKSRPFTDPKNGVPPKDAEPNPQARYACHFHRTGTGTEHGPRVVEGCVVNGSPGWGYVNHASFVRFEDNVSFRVFGAGFVAETGAERGAFRRNFALRSHGSGSVPDGRQFKANSEGSIDDFGHGGYGFWFQGPAITVEDNVAAGHRHYGFVYWNRAKPDAEVSADTLDSLVGKVPNLPVEALSGQPELARSDRVEDGMVPSSFVRLESFARNTVFASGGGLDISRHMFTFSHERVDAYSVVEDFTAFNVGSHVSQWDRLRPPNSRGAQGGENGISIRYSANVVIRNPTLVSGSGGRRGVAINRNHAPANVHVENPDIEGWFTGIRAPPRGSAPIRGGRLDNHIDVHVIGGTTDRRWSEKQHVDIDDVTFGDGGRAEVSLSAELDDHLYGLFTPEGHVRRDGTDLYFAEQAPDFVPFPSKADLRAANPGDDALADLSDVSPGALVGKSNAELFESFGLAVEGEVLPEGAGGAPGVESGFVAGGTGDAASQSLAPIERVHSAEGSVYELGRLRSGEPVYVYDDSEFLTVPGRYTGLPYVRPEVEDADSERRSFLTLTLSSPSTVYVAYDSESEPGWLSGWTDTGDTLGTSDGTRRVYERDFDAGTVRLGGAVDTHSMYSAFVRER